MQRMRLIFSGAFLLISVSLAEAQQAGSIRGTVYDKDYDIPLAGAQVLIAENGLKAAADDGGGFVFSKVAPGKYTLVFSKDGYARQVSSDVVVPEGQMTEVSSSLAGEYTEMDELVVQDLQLGGGMESGLLNLRMESPALMDSISSELMSRAGAGDAAGALRMVPGATVQDGKYAVVRGLPDRYVSSQMGGVRLPTADVDKRAVQLDQFPSAVIESIQISKTFTPDQQGDASGGAVNLLLKGIPDETILKFKIGTEYNTQMPGKGDFLTYKGGGLNFWGLDDGSRDMQTAGATNSWRGAVGVSRGDALPAYNWMLTAGGKKEVMDGLKIGGIGNFYYKQNSSYYDNGVNNAYSVDSGAPPGSPLTPVTTNPNADPIYSALFDVTKGSQEVQWGGLGAVGAETENHALKLMYMRTQATKDTAILAEDTRGKAYFLKNPLDPSKPDDPRLAPYWRSESLEYVERKTDTLQLHGSHTLAFPETGVPGYFVLLPPEVDWTVAKSFSGLKSPDKRMFASVWYPQQVFTNWGITNVAHFEPKVPPENGKLGNFQRIWKDISEESQQYFANGKLPFEQWSGDKGYLKLGVFNDKVARNSRQDSFSNLDDKDNRFDGNWDDYWSSVFPSQYHPIQSSDVDVNYKGQQNISAWYWMADLPLSSFLKAVGGFRYEDTEIKTVNDPKANAKYININKITGAAETVWLGSSGGAGVDRHAADVNLQTNNLLPSIGFELKPVKPLSLRASYSETVARPTFKEITPVQQMEYVGAPIFIGSRDLTMSTLKNYDLRADYTPAEGSLISLSWFHKDILKPIEYQQVVVDTLYTMPVNYPKGKLTGVELEARQQLGRFWDPLDGLAAGANATIIKSEVTLPANQSTNFPSWAPMKTRDMVNAPAFLYNLNLTYDIKKTDTQLGLFYIVQGDTLVVGALPKDFIPNVYAKEYGTLNFSISQKIGKYLKLTFQAKNLMDPAIQEVYRSEYIPGGDTVKASYKKGIDYSLSLGGEF